MAVELDFNEERFLKLLTNLIGETKYLQDNPPKFVPEENRYEFYIGKVVSVVLFAHIRAIKHLLDVLQPYTKEKGGLLKVDHVTYVEGRGNLIIEYDNVSMWPCSVCATRGIVTATMPMNTLSVQVSSIKEQPALCMEISSAKIQLL